MVNVHATDVDNMLTTVLQKCKLNVCYFTVIICYSFLFILAVFSLAIKLLFYVKSDILL